MDIRIYLLLLILKVIHSTLLMTNIWFIGFVLKCLCQKSVCQGNRWN